MIVREKPSLIRLFFIFRLSVLERIYPQLLWVMALSALVVIGHALRPTLIPSAPGAPFALIGIALSIFLGFRNNACYDRWWEARKLWGHLVAVCRDLARQTLLLDARGSDGIAGRQRLLGCAILFAGELVRLLRGSYQFAGTVKSGLDPADHDDLVAGPHAPDAILTAMGQTVADLRRQGTISDIEYTLFDRSLTEMAGVMTACERLHTTPVPFGYTLLLHRTAYLFCFMLPFGFADVLSLATPLATGVVAYAFFGLDALSEELEEPFGTSPNDLPIAAIARGIELNLRRAMGETDLPPAPQPVGFVLL